MFPEYDEMPRMAMSAASWPGSPLVDTALRPGVIPTRADDILATGAWRISSPVTAVMAPVTLTFFCVANAVTTTSSRCCLSSFRTMASLVLFPAGMFVSEKPMHVTRMTALSGTSSQKFPSASVIVPFFVPASMTVAPMTGIPASSTTLPVMVFFCCCTESDASGVFSDIIPDGRGFMLSALVGGGDNCEEHGWNHCQSNNPIPPFFSNCSGMVSVIGHI